jgi:predicted permease
MRVVGVMPAGFDYPDGTSLWYPLELQRQSESRTSHNWSGVTGRLRADAGLERALAELNTITATFVDDEGPSEFLPVAVRLYTLRDALVGTTARPLWILLGASVLVLLVASTNLASATLARGAGRTREYAVRRSLGAGRSRIIRQLFIESLVLAATGALLGVAAAAGALRLLPAVVPAGVPRIAEVGIELPVLAVTVFVTFMTSVLFGLLPALRLSDGTSAEALRSGGRGGGSRGRTRMWQSLIAVEVAFALVLLIGSGLLIRSLLAVLAVQPGYRTENVLTATLNPAPSRYSDAASRREYYATLLRELEATPGIEAVGLISAPPMAGLGSGSVHVRDPRGIVTRLSGDYHLVTPQSFAALGIALERGRAFDDRDNERAPHVAIVNSAFAEQAWPGEDPIGRQITGGGMDDLGGEATWSTVIGVVANVRQRSLEREPEPAYYFPLRQRPFRSWAMTAVIRPAGGEAVALGSAVRTAIARVDNAVPVALATIESVVSDALVPRRFTVFVLAFFALTALALACVGIWGVVAYAVARRTREIGIRMALGADPSNARRLVQSEFLRGAAVGGLAGLVLAIVLARLLRSLLFGIQPTDPATVLIVVAVLGAATWLASFLPSLRSSRISPAEAMQTE